MKLLLDTHVLLWAAGAPERLASDVRALLDDPDNQPIFSAVAVDALPAIHKDPFDRILVAQAIVESVTLLTADAIVARYPGPVRKI